MRRWTTLAVALLALVLVAGAYAKPIKMKQQVPGNFTIGADCSFLPDGVVITGAGDGKSTDVFNEKKDGIATFSNHTVIRGHATDADGNSYKWVYDNSFKVTNSKADPGTFTGTMTDSFTLKPTGHGKQHNDISLANGFEANVTTDLAPPPDGIFVIDPTSSFGDPIDFDTGMPHCDPL